MLPYVFHLLVDGCVEEIDVPARTETEAWVKAREIQRDLYDGQGELRLWY